MRCLLTILMVLSLATAKGQEPAILSLQGFVGDKYDFVTNINPATDGGFIVTIESNSSAGTGNMDSFCFQSGSRTVFRKYNGDGTQIEWNKCYNNQVGDSFFAYIFPRTDGSFLLGGSFKAFMGRGFLIAKLDGLDNIVWQRDYCKGSDPILQDMLATADGGYIMTGDIGYSDTTATTHYGNNLVPDIAVLKLDSLGNKLWCRVLGGTGYDYPEKLIPGPNDGVYVVGRSTSIDYDCIGNHGSGDVFVARLDVNGNIIWAKCFGGSLAEGGQSACADGQSGILVAGYANSNDGDVNGHMNGRNSWVLNIDSNGTIVWNDCYGGGGFEYANAICQTAGGNIWLGSNITTQGGQIDTTYDNADVWFALLDHNGALLSSKVMGSSDQDVVNALYPLPGEICLAGGGYRQNDICFSTLSADGLTNMDAYLVGFAPWTATTAMATSVHSFIVIYPNPASNSINIDFKAEKRIRSSIRVSDISGRIFYEQGIKGNVKIDVSDWPRGTYLVEVKLSERDRVVKKVLLQ